MKLFESIQKYKSGFCTHYCSKEKVGVSRKNSKVDLLAARGVVKFLIKFEKLVVT